MYIGQGVSALGQAVTFPLWITLKRGVPLRGDPSEQRPPRTTIPTGSTVKLTGESGNYYIVESFTGPPTRK